MALLSTCRSHLATEAFHHGDPGGGKRLGPAAACDADRRKHPSAMDLYVGCLNNKLYGPNGNARHWPRQNVTSSLHDGFTKEANADTRDKSFQRDDIKMSRVNTGMVMGSDSEALPRRVDTVVNDGAPETLCHTENLNALTICNSAAVNSPGEKEGSSSQPSPVTLVKEQIHCVAASPMNALDNITLQDEIELVRSKSMNRLGSSQEELSSLTSRHKSSEQCLNNCYDMKSSTNERKSKCSMNRGNLVVSSIKVSGYSSGDSWSSVGSPVPKEGGRWPSGSSISSVDSSCSSPTSKDGVRRTFFSSAGSSDGGSPVPKDGRRSSFGSFSLSDSSSSGGDSSSGRDGFRRPSIGNVLNYRESPTSVISRGMGNIMTGGSMGNQKPSFHKFSCNDSSKLEHKWSVELSTPRHCGEGNILGRHASGIGIETSNKANLSLANLQDHDMACTKETTDPEKIKNLGNEMYKRGCFSEAIKLYDSAIALCPNHAPYRSNKAAALSGLGKLAEAVQECEEAIRLDSSYTRAHQRAASIYMRLGLVESAKRHNQAAGHQTDMDKALIIQTVERQISNCIEARKSEDWKSVLKESDTVLVSGADSSPQILGYKSEALWKLHRIVEADEVCSKSLKVEHPLRKLGILPADCFLHMLRAQIDLALGRFEGAIDAAEFALRIDPHNADANTLLRKTRMVGKSRMHGNELFKLGRFFEACVAYGEGLENDPTNAVLLCNRAACRSKLGQWEKAIEDCDAALNALPNYTKALMRRANCSIKLERWQDALRDYEILQREIPGDMDVARGLFDVQVAVKKSQGEETYKMKFGGDVEEVCSMDQFRETVSAPGISVVQFGAKWSQRCKQLSPFIDQLCKLYPCVNFVKVDVDENAYLAKTESINFVPTFKIYKSGHKVKEILGPSQQSLESAIKHYSL